jgi:hypothetical protein
MKGETILFRFLGSDQTFTREEVKSIIRKDSNALFTVYPVWARGEPRYKFLGSEELYTLEEMRAILNRDPLAALIVYQSNRGSPNRENRDRPPMCQVGKMDGKTALQKFG